MPCPAGASFGSELDHLAVRVQRKQAKRVVGSLHLVDLGQDLSVRRVSVVVDVQVAEAVTEIEFPAAVHVIEDGLRLDATRWFAELPSADLFRQGHHLLSGTGSYRCCSGSIHIKQEGQKHDQSPPVE